MTETSTTIAVVPCCIVFEGVQLANGETFVTELNTPRHRFAVVITTGGAIEIISMTDGEEEAIETARRLEEQLKGLACVPAGAVLQ